ncbi:MAG: DUF309 domain-containing protein, partial [Planctomycetaceae bacterium]
ALFHFGNENLGGAREMYHAATEKLQPYGPEYWGLNVEKLLGDMQHCFQELLDAKETYPDGVALKDERVPRMEFSG